MWKELNIYDRWMFGVLLLLVASTNTSTGGSSIGIGLGGLILLVQMVRTRHLPVVDKEIVKVILLQAGLWFAVSMFSLDPMCSLRELWSMTYQFLPLFFAMLCIKEKWQLHWIWTVFALSVFADTSRALWQCAVSQDLISGYRPVGFNKWPTFLASHMLMALPVLLFSAGRDYVGPREKKFFFLVAAMAFFVLILSGTRGGWLAFLGTTAVYAFCKKEYRRRAAMMALSMVLILCLAAACSGTFRDRLVTFTNPAYQGNSERLLMWQSTVNMIKDYPLTGIGIDMFGEVYNAKYISPLAKERPESSSNPRSGHGHPHNNFLKMLCEGGIVGLFAFLVLHGYFFWRFFQLWKQEKHPFPYGLMAMLVLTALQIEGMVETNMSRAPIMREYWLLVGIVLAAGQMEQGKNEGSNG